MLNLYWPDRLLPNWYTDGLDRCKFHASLKLVLNNVFLLAVGSYED